MTDQFVEDVRLRGLLTHSELCRDCQACTLACSLYHEDECSPSLARVHVLKDMAKYRFQIIVCCYTATADASQEQPSAAGACTQADCVAACPNEALRFDEAGFPVIYQDECLQCGACAGACPFEAIFFDPRSGRYLKCDLCAGRPEGPVCAQICPVGAMTEARSQNPESSRQKLVVSH